MSDNIDVLVKIDTVVLDQIVADLPRKASAVVQKYGEQIAGVAAALTPKDTHALENSIPSESELEEPLKFVVQDGVEYGIYQEIGTYKMAAHPFLVPAVEQYAEMYFDAFREIF